MLRRAELLLLSVATTAAVLVASAAGASADGSHGKGNGGGGGGGSQGGWGNVGCSQHPYPGCQLGAGTGGSTRVTSTGHSPGGGSEPVFSCLNLVPFAPAYGKLPPPAGQKASSGAWYTSVCSGFHFGMPGGGVFYPPIWVATGNAPPPPSPAVVARQAENKLTLPTPMIVLSPAGKQLVNLPTWLAIDQNGWGARSATAAVPGVSVTATATPASVSWSTGDGATITCHGPGTVFTAADDPVASSPTCGHTYRASSAAQPGGRFVVVATVRWSIRWAGAGQAGTFDDLTTTSTTRVPVAQSPALNSH